MVNHIHMDINVSDSFKYQHILLAGLQSNSGLWIDDVRLSVRPSICLSVRPSTFG